MSLFIAVSIFVIYVCMGIKAAITELITYIHKDKTVKNEDASLPNNDIM